MIALFVLASCGKTADEYSSSSEASSIASSDETSSEETEESSSETETPAPPKVIDKEEYILKYQNLYKQTGTYTGRPALPEIELAPTDPENEAGYSNQKFGYSFGVAVGEKPHQTSLNHQKNFKDNGFNAITVDTDTSEKRLYLTFDCGYELGYTWSLLDTLKEKNVKAVFFCTLYQIQKNPELTARMIDEGHIVANHSVNHKSMPTLSRQEMASEIEGVENYLRKHFGYSTKYFRFPTGEYSENSLECVTSLGIRMAFWSIAYNDYDTANQPGKALAFQTVTERLHPGAVILLHSTSESNMQALGDIIDYAHQNGYVFRSLDDYEGWVN